ncbi:ABC transporter permease [Cohnella zeiphila]|uniref:ABC transporter permease n=1 Tax=Cohnella zeiphila TaxID=2761120 RepID=A0A7X0VX62_9BACL|nr:ABC transporter permease [Cohnella zeiphila]MBB6733944.1 ABC transporter permease [Cohnella zeiphila]
MNGYGALSGRYLKQQRKRSILTIIGIILSVALISAIGTMGQSLTDNMLQRAIYEQGAYHFGYGKADAKLYNELKNNVLVGKLGFVTEGQDTALDDTFKIRLSEVNADFFELAPVHLQEGRWPQNDREAVLEQWMLSHLPGKPKIGDEAKLNGPDGKPASYRIVGVMINSKNSQLNAESSAYTLTNEGGIPSGNFIVLAAFKPGVDISSHLKAFSGMGEKFKANDQMLAYMGESSDNNINKVFAIIFGTLIGLVVLSTAAVIYNIFHISVLERIRQFGLLRTIGATPAQIRSLVFREATVLGIIGIPIGLLVGWGALWLAIKLMLESGFKILQMEDFKLTVHAWIIGGSALIGLLSVYLAAWLPARKAASVSPVEAVRGAGSIVRESFRRGRIPSPLQGFGVGGKMAAKNIRRNRSKFRITTFSIVISVCLFTVFHYFTQETLFITTDSNEEDRIAFSVYPNRDTSDKPFMTQEQMDDLASTSGVRGVYGDYWSNGSAVWVPENKLNPNFYSVLRRTPAEMQRDGAKYVFTNGIVNLYDDARLKDSAPYLVAGTVDPKKLAADNAVLIVQTVKPVDPKDGKRTQLDMTSYKVGDKLLIDMSQSEKPDSFQEVTVGGILSQSPFGETYLKDNLNMMAPRQVFERLNKAVPVQPGEESQGPHMYGIDIAMKDGADNGAIRAKLQALVDSQPNIRISDIAAQQKEERQFNLQMQIFVYGFLIVIGGIGSLNIINTVQTNLLLRRREFGLLQAVGMTVRQLRRMASLEGIWYGALGSFWGLVSGYVLSYLLFIELSGLQGMPFRFPWPGVLIACGIALLVGLLSVQGPMSRISKANLIDSLREEA